MKHGYLATRLIKAYVVCVLSGVVIGIFHLNAVAQQSSGAGSVDIRWGEPYKILHGDDLKFHAGETLKLRAEGVVCRAHTHETKQKGWLVWKRTITIDHDNWVDPAQMPPAVVFLNIASDMAIGSAVNVGSNPTTVTVPAGPEGLNTKVSLASYIPGLDSGNRGRSHGIYTLVVEGDARSRLDQLEKELSRVKLTPAQIKSPDLFCTHVKKLDPAKAAAMILQHIEKFYLSSGNQNEIEELYKAALELDGANPRLITGLGEQYLKNQRYDQAQPALIEAVKQARASLAGQKTQANYQLLARAAQALAQVYENKRGGLVGGDLDEADQLLGEAAQAYRNTGDTLIEREMLIRRARVLQRIRTTEALRTAIECLKRARSLSPRVLGQ